MRFAITRPILPLTALLLALCSRPAAAQQGEVTGRVTDKTSGTALATAQVSVVGTTIRALTGQDGRYRLVNVPPGTATLRVSYIGYATTTPEESGDVVDIRARHRCARRTHHCRIAAVAIP